MLQVLNIHGFDLRRALKASPGARAAPTAPHPRPRTPHPNLLRRLGALQSHRELGGRGARLSSSLVSK